MTRGTWIPQSIVLLAILAVCSCATDRAAEVAVGVAAERDQLRSFAVYPVEKIRPRAIIDRYASADSPTVSIAGFEREACLVGIQNGSPEAVEISSVTISAPGRTGLLQLVDVSVYRVEYADIEKGTIPIGGWDQGGRWPDPLIPVAAQPGTMHQTDELRFAFPTPVEVPTRENRIILVDIFLPQTVARAVREQPLVVDLLDDRGVQLTSTLVTVRLLPFELPRDQSLATTVGFSWPRVARTHSAISETPVDAGALHLDYLHELAKNRMFVFWPSASAVEANYAEDGSLVVDWSPFEKITGRMLDGTLFPDVPRATAFRFPMHAGYPDGAGAQFTIAAAEYLEEKGWIDRAYYYLPDEPLRRQYPAVRDVAARVLARAPGVRRLATEPYVRALEGSVEIWCPDVFALGHGLPVLPAFYKGNTLYLEWQWNRLPRVYEKRRSLGEESWFYTCSTAQSGTYPNLFIDYPAAYHRVIGWLAFRYGFSGYLHWSTSYSYAGDGNPWEDQYRVYANGDGNLLYPGVPEYTGLDQHVAVPSLRMILFREGADDYEYLSLLAAQGEEGAARADRIARSIVGDSQLWKRDVDDYGSAKEEIIAVLLRN